MPTIRNVIDAVDGLVTNSYTDAQKLVWLNEVEKDVKENVVKTFSYTTIRRLADTSEYDLPNGVSFEDIDTVYIEGKEADKLDQRSFIDGTTSGDYGYYKTANSKFGINPTPSSDDDSDYPRVRICYKVKFTDYTSANSYGTTMLITDTKNLRVYKFYLMAQIALFNKEFELYNNYMGQFNTAWKEFSDEYQRKQPVNKASVIRNLW